MSRYHAIRVLLPPVVSLPAHQVAEVLNAEDSDGSRSVLLSAAAEGGSSEIFDAVLEMMGGKVKRRASGG